MLQRTLHPAIQAEPLVVQSLYAFDDPDVFSQKDLMAGAFGPLLSPDDREPDCWAWLKQTIETATDDDLFRIREEFHYRYAWAIPHPGALDLIMEHAPNGLVEIGAGNGYWAYLLQQRGLNVTAYDRRPVGRGNNPYWPKFSRWTQEPTGPHYPWTKVLYGQPVSIQRHRKDVSLFLCWPPYGDSMAYDSLRYYRGSTVIFVGEVGGCTGDDLFHAALDTQWEEVADFNIPQFWGLHDGLLIYRRKNET